MIEHTYDDRRRMAIEHTHMMIEQPTMMINDPNTHEDRALTMIEKTHDDRDQ